MDERLARTGIDHSATESARRAAEEPVRWPAVAVGEIGEQAVVGEKPHVAPDAAAAAELPRPTGVAQQLEALDHDRVARLLRLYGNVRGVESPRHPLAA